MPPDIGQRFAYPGFDSLPRGDGIPANFPFLSNWTVSVRNTARAAPTHNLICAQVLARLVTRPGYLQVQRNVELVRAVREILRGPYPAWRPGGAWAGPNGFDPGNPLHTNLPAIIEGGSAGGAMSVWCVTLFPEDFNAAFNQSGPLSMRRYIGEQFAMDYLMALSGFGRSGRDWYVKDILDYCTAFWQVGGSAQHGIPSARGDGTPLDPWSPFFHGSALRGWVDGTLKRPIYSQIADEDSVSTGTDWVPLLSGQRQFVQTGVTANAAGVRMAWSIIPKRCHDGQFTTPNPFTGTEHQVNADHLLDFLAALTGDPEFEQMRTFTAPATPANATEDCYDHALQPATPVPPPPNPPSPALRLDTQFSSTALSALPAAARRPGKSFGLGTYLGHEDSLITGPPLDPDVGVVQECFVGSAEGVVSRLVVDAATLELEPLAISEALGTGAWGLVTSEIDGGSPGEELIVGTHRGLHVLSRATLATLRTNRDLPWEMSRPLHLAMADFVPGGKSEVVMASQLGTLAIYDVDTLQPLGTYGEPGIVDLEVLNNTGTPVRIALLSDRGHVVTVGWDPAENAPGLVAVSPRLNGIPVDMELADVDAGNPGAELVVWMLDTVNTHEEDLWILDAASLQPTRDPPTNLVSTTPAYGGAADTLGIARDLEVVVDGQEVHFAFLRGSNVLVLSSSGGGGLTKHDPLELMSFAPLHRALDIEIADITTEGSVAAGASPLDVVVATEAGYVSWFPFDYLVNAPDPDQKLDLGGGAAFSRILPFTSDTWYQTGAVPRPFGVPNAPHLSCCRTLAGTWGMAVDDAGGTLELLDQSGTRWSVDGAGDVTFRYEVGRHVEVNSQSFFGPLPGPFRDLAFLGPVVGESVGAAVDIFPPSSKTHIPSSTGQPLLPALEETRAGYATGQPEQGTFEVRTYPYVPYDVPPSSGVFLVTGDGSGTGTGSGTWVSEDSTVLPYPRFHHRLFVYDGWAAFPKGGDVLQIGSDRHACWWSGQADAGTYGNRVQGITVDASGTVTNWWSSLGGQQVDQGQVQGNTITGYNLRSTVSLPLAMHDAQALRMFEDSVNGPMVALLTPGARLIVLKPGTGEQDLGQKFELEGGTTTPLDFGTGGMALAAAPRPGSTTLVDLYVGSVSYFADDTNFKNTGPGTGVPDDSCSALASVEWDASASALRITSLTLLDSLTDPLNAPLVYGVCGIAVGDVIPGNGMDEIVVTSLDGNLMVYERGGDGGIGQLLHHERVEGALGAYNSIVIEDLDSNVTGKELYVAGSLGLRKWIWQ